MQHIKRTKTVHIMCTTFENNDNVYCACMSMQINNIIVEVHFNCPLSTVINDQNLKNKFHTECQKFICENIELFSNNATQY